MQTGLIARDRQGAEIDIGRIGAVDTNLRIASGFALFKGGEIHIGIGDGAFDLVDIIAGQEDRGAMGIDPKRRRSHAMAGRARQIVEHFGLFCGLFCDLFCRLMGGLVSHLNRGGWSKAVLP